jgi:FAD/FMN-containing dehydrogenase
MITSSSLEHLKRRFNGRLIEPHDVGYDAARLVWNGMIDRKPALVAQCGDVHDVVSCIAFARENDLRVAVRGGGHSVAGHGSCDHGLVIDLSGLRSVQVDPQARVAHCGGGATWADVDRATQPFALATPGGVVSDTGIGGLTLGGGHGHLRNLYGLSCDNLLAAEVVTADGSVVHASEQQNRELLWGLRGGGGNFGVVTRMDYRLHPVGPTVMFLAVFHDGARAAEALRFYRGFNGVCPPELSTIAFIGRVAAGAPAFPPTAHGRPFVAFVGVYAGPVAEGEQVVAPLRALAPPLADLSGPVPYVQAQTFFDEEYPAHEMRYYWKSLHLPALGDEVIDLIVDHALRQPSAHSTTDLWPIGGGVREFGGDTSAYYGRHAAYLVNPEANWRAAQHDAANVAWVRTFIDALAEHSDGSRYLNFAGFQEEGESMMRQGYGPHYDRLVALKRTYDLDNVFQLNPNIPPA